MPNNDLMEINYFVPQLGNITTKLYKYSGYTYEILDNYNHIDRMRQIHQLGVIRNVFEGAHHSRWEYVMVQLGIIYKLSTFKDIQNTKLARGLGLSAKLDVLEHKPSGADILQMWVLLFNAGHLPGTFATERGLFQLSIENHKFNSMIKRGLSSSPIMQNYFKKLKTQENIYGFHKILSFFHLQRYKRYKCSDDAITDLIQLLSRIIELYHESDDRSTEKVRRLKKVFHRIRQVSYLFLDSQYGPIPFDFNLGAIFFNLEDYIATIFQEQDIETIKTLNSFDNLLSVNMYHTPHSIRELGFHSNKIHEYLKNSMDSKHLNLITNFQKLLLNEYDLLMPEFMDWKNTPCFHLLFDFQNSFMFNDFLKNLSFITQKVWNNRYGSSYCQLTFQPSPSKKQFAITVAFSTNAKKNIFKVSAQLLKDIVNLNNTLKKNGRKRMSFFIDMHFNKPIEGLFCQILEEIIDESLQIEFKHDVTIHNKFRLIMGSTKASSLLRKDIKDFIISETRRHELETLCQALEIVDHKTHLLISLSTILIYSSERKQIAEIDGIVIGAKNNNLYLIIIEAKNQRRRRGADSERQLRDTLTKLKMHTTSEPTGWRIEGGSYCYIKINGEQRADDIQA